MTDLLERPGTSTLRVGLTLGGIVLAAVVVFGLGVMEGSRVVERLPAVAAPPSALPTETLQPQPQPAAPLTPAPPLQPDKLTFYDRLSGAAPPAPTPVALPEAQPPVQGHSPAPPAQGADARQPEAQPPRAVAATRKTAAAATTAAARTAVPPKSDPAAQIRKLAGKGLFSVQVAAVSDRAAATETAALVKRNGFDAIIVMASVKGKILYRVRVGSFPSKSNATRAAEIFHSTLGLDAIPVAN